MTDRVISHAARKAAYAENTQEAFVILLTLSCANWDDDARVSSDPAVLLPIAGERGTISRGLEYVFLPFQIELPGEDEAGTSAARITIDAVNRKMIQLIRSAGKANISVKIEVVLASAPDAPQVTCNNLRLQSADYNAMTVTAELSTNYFDLEPFPYGRIVKAMFPGMF